MIKNAWDLILHVNQTINTYGKYNALLFAAFLILFLTMEQRKQKEQNEQPALMLLTISSVLILWNPLFIAFFIKAIPYFTNYWQLLWSVPVFFIIAQGAAVAYSKTGYQKKGIVFGIVLIALAGTILPYQSTEARTNNQYGIPKAEYEAFVLIEQNMSTDEVSLVGPNEIMEYARIYSASMNLPYGKDLWKSGIDGKSQTNQTYSPQSVELYQLMQAPYIELERIVEIAEQEGCTVIVLPVTEETESNQVLEESGYQNIKSTQKYHIFIRKG